MTTSWRELLAVGLVAGDLGPRTIARHSGRPLTEVEKALVDARAAGVLVVDGDGDESVDEDEARDLVGALPARQVAEIHAAVGRTLLVHGADRVDDAVDHLRAASSMVPPEELLAIIEHSARMCLSLGDYGAATQLYRLASDLDPRQFDRGHVEHLLGLSRALDGSGRPRESHEVVLEACDLAIQLDAADLAADAVIDFVLPVDWNHRDRRAIALLDRVQSMALDPDRRIAVDAVRALAESWIPAASIGEQQVAWVSRSSVSQPMAERVLQASNGASPRTRLIALLAWRWTHRGPSYLELRRERSAEALDLAQTIGDTAMLIEAAMALAVDSLESVDRGQYERTLTVVRWVADHDNSPGVRWRIGMVLTGALHLDGDEVAAHESRVAISAAAAPYGVAGWFAADRLGLAHEAWYRDDAADLVADELDERDPEVQHPTGRLFMARLHADRGDRGAALNDLRRVVANLDPEASILFVSALAAEVAIALDDSDSMERLVELLEPYTHSVAVDAHAWWCAGPVSMVLASLHHALGNEQRARVLLGLAESTARAINDVRSIDRVERLREILGPGDDDDGDGLELDLTTRQRAVLRRIVEGRTNPEIAAELSFSVSTIRMETIAIYRVLGVSGRKEATRHMLETGLVDLL